MNNNEYPIDSACYDHMRTGAMAMIGAGRKENHVFILGRSKKWFYSQALRLTVASTKSFLMATRGHLPRHEVVEA